MKILTYMVIDEDSDYGDVEQVITEIIYDDAIALKKYEELSSVYSEVYISDPSVISLKIYEQWVVCVDIINGNIISKNLRKSNELQPQNFGAQTISKLHKDGFITNTAEWLVINDEKDIEPVIDNFLNEIPSLKTLEYGSRTWVVDRRIISNNKAIIDDYRGKLLLRFDEQKVYKIKENLYYKGIPLLKDIDISKFEIEHQEVRISYELLTTPCVSG